MLKRCWSHRSAMGPSGDLASRGSRPGSASNQRGGASGRSMVIARLLASVDDPEHDSEGNEQLADRYQQRQAERQRPDRRVEPLAVDPERLERAPRAVVQV